QARVELLGFGLRKGKHYFGLSISEQAHAQVIAPDEFFQFIKDYSDGFENGAASYDLSRMQAKIQHYRPYMLTYALDVNPDFTIGFQASYISGVSSFAADNSFLMINQPAATPIGFDVEGMVDVRAAGLFTLDSTVTEVGEYFLQPQNHGFSFGFGTRYALLDQKLELSLAATNLGVIYWKTHVNRNAINTSGIENAEDLETAWDETFSQIYDGYVDYNQSLVPSILLGAYYNFKEENGLGLVLNAHPIDGRLNPAVALNFNTRIQKWLGIAAGYNYSNNSHNLGLGLSINPGPVQLYIVSDNISSVLVPESAKKLHANVGLNFTIGKHKRNEERLPDSAFAAINPIVDPTKASDVTVDVNSPELQVPVAANLPSDFPEYALYSSSNVYQSPSETSAVLTQFHEDEVVTVRHKFSAEWWYVQRGSVYGWIPASTMMPPAVPKDVQAKTEPVVKSLTPKGSVDPNKAPSDPYYNPVDIQDPTIKDFILTSATLLLDQAGESGTIIAVIEAGSEINVLNKSSREWWQVKSGKLEGWIRPKDLLLPKVVPPTPEPIVKGETTTEKGTGLYKSLPAKALTDANVGNQFKLEQKTEMWANPNTDNQVAILPAGLSVKLINKNPNGWWKVAYDDLEGYIRMGKSNHVAASGSNTNKAATGSNEPSQGTLTLTGETSLRQDATHKSSVLTRLYIGNEVELLEKTNQFWWKVRYQGMVGWVKAAKVE
ncbi:MAG: SH3 domain-containing protein, partial [Phaeodactylibacter sp.]|nr:SH3 domain-containing protein [Phaeodactylibacter sp.]